MGSCDRQGDPPGDRLAGPAHRGRLRALARPRPRSAGARDHRPAHRCLLLGHQARVDPRPRGRRARCSRAWRARVRHGRHLAAVAADRWPRARDRRDQCVSHDAVRHPPRRLGRHAAGAVRHSAQPAARGPCVEPPLRPHRGQRARRTGRDRRCGRRPAGRAFRSRLRDAGPGEEHLRHWLLPADGDRRALPVLGQRADHDACGAGRNDGDSSGSSGAGRIHAAVRPRGQRLHRRCGRAMVARRAAGDSSERRCRAPRRERARQRRRGVRAGLHRSRRAVLAGRRTRRDRRADTRQHGRAHCARRARKHRVPEHRAVAGDEPRRRRGRWHRGDRTSRRRRCLRQRPADAVSGRPARHPGRAAGRDRDHRARGGDARRARLRRMGRLGCGLHVDVDGLADGTRRAQLIRRCRARGPRP